MLLAARHSVDRINISRGIQGTKNVIARLRTREDGIRLECLLGKPLAVSLTGTFKIFKIY